MSGKSGLILVAAGIVRNPNSPEEILGIRPFFSANVRSHPDFSIRLSQYVLNMQYDTAQLRYIKFQDGIRFTGLTICDTIFYKGDDPKYQEGIENLIRHILGNISLNNLDEYVVINYRTRDRGDALQQSPPRYFYETSTRTLHRIPLSGQNATPHVVK